MKITKGRIWSLVLCSLLPLAAMALGVVLLVAHTLWNSDFVIFYVLLPLAAIGGLAGILLFVKKIGSRIAGTVLLLLAFVLCFLFGNLIGKFEMLDRYEGAELISHYSAVTDEFERMPTLEQVGKPESMTYYDYSCAVLIFNCDAHALLCSYDRAEYAAQKAAIGESYRFQEGQFENFYKNGDSSAQVDGWQFHLLAEEEPGILYPKKLILIGFQETQHRIVYLSFYDADIDYIDDLEGFILDRCGWKHMG